MRYRLLLFTPVCLILFGGTTKTSDLMLISRLDEVVQTRFRTALPGELGMSRIAVPPSMGRHFQPISRNERDFIPENALEREIIRELEDKGVHVGLYVFGRAVVDAPPEALSYRTLKGPGAITRGTPRPAWYPGQPMLTTEPAGALPDWKSVYPLAKRAMESFRDGGTGFETTLQGWEIAVRPVVAEQRCRSCHIPNTAVTTNEPIGGVLYAFLPGNR